MSGNGEKTLVLMVGCSGSGKSTKAREIGDHYQNFLGIDTNILSTDDLFMVDGVYKWNGAKLHRYHELNLQKAEFVMQATKPDDDHCIIIDNTNVSKKDRAPYVELAEKYGFKVRLEVVGSTDPAELEKYAARNAHGTSLAHIQKQARRMNTDL